MLVLSQYHIIHFFHEPLGILSVQNIVEFCKMIQYAVFV